MIVTGKNWTMHLGDCRDVLPTIERVDALITDPPYGIGKWSSGGGNSISAEECAAVNAWDVAPDPEVMQMAISSARCAIVWGGNYLMDTLGRTRAPLIWDKGLRGMHFADGEMAWTNFDYGTLRIFSATLASLDTKGQKSHPTQKPVALMFWCIEQVKPSPQTILDAFAGSGTTGVAALRLGRKFIGIERDAKYFELACDRLRAEEEGSTLQARRAGQGALFK